MPPAPVRRALLAVLLGVGWLMLTTAGAQAAAEIVVAIRYLQAQGVSHSHLYLYREDGKLLRQLTNDDSGQEHDPVFSPDGETIVFTRDAAEGDAKTFWSIEPRGGKLHELDEAPPWYAGGKSSTVFTNLDPDLKGGGESSDAPSADEPPKITAPDGVLELTLREDPKDEDDQGDSPGHGRHYELRDKKSGRTTPLGKLPGFEGLYDLLHSSADPKQRFLWEPALQLAFFDLHLNSTDGDTCFALDLTAPASPRIVRLSPNWAAPFPLPGEPAFLTLTENRYVPIPGSAKTANCSYTDRWDAQLKKVRFAREKSAPIAYGASMYRPNGQPAVISIRKGAD